MATPAFLVSLLTSRYLMLKDRFSVPHPNPWLVWEAGTWASDPEGSHATSTLPATNKLPDRPKAGDGLCFELSAGPPGAPVILKVGRGEENDLNINDMTVSRSQFVIVEGDAGIWRIERGDSSQAASYGGKALEPGIAVPLIDNEILRVGNVVLTYQTPLSFIERLKAAAAKLQT